MGYPLPNGTSKKGKNEKNLQVCIVIAIFFCRTMAPLKHKCAQMWQLSSSAFFLLWSVCFLLLLFALSIAISV